MSSSSSAALFVTRPGASRTALAFVATLAALAELAAGARPALAQRERPAHGPERSRVDTTVALASGGTVELSLRTGTATVTAWSRREVRIVAEADGGGLEFEASSGHVSLGATHGSGETRYEISVPADARLVLESQSADLTVRGVSGAVEANSNSGDVDLSDVTGDVQSHTVSGAIHVSGAATALRLETVSGDIEADGAGGLVDVETVSGEIVLTAMRAHSLRAETVSGDITYDGDIAADGHYELHAHSGDIRLRLAEATNARLGVETYNGEFESDFPVQMQPASGQRQGDRRFEVAIGTGAGAAIDIETFNGDIHLGRSGTRPRSIPQRATP